MPRRPGPGVIAVRRAAGRPLQPALPSRAPRWARVAETAVFFLFAVYLFVLAWLTIAAAGLVAGFGHSATIITSNSMGPSIRSGDIVLSEADVPADIGPGTVITFTRPGYPDQLLTHRVIAAADGVLSTKGDANFSADSSVVAVADVVGVGRVLVPVIATPIVWARSGAWAPLALWGIVTLIAFDFVVVAPLRIRFRHRNLQLGRIEPGTRDPRPIALGFVAGLVARIHPKHRSRRWLRRVRGQPEPEVRPPAVQIIGAGIIAIGSLVLATIGVAHSAAAFAFPETNDANTFSAMMWLDIVSLAAGDAHSCAARAEGSVWCWGKNDKGQVGDNTTTDSDFPVQVTGTGGTGVLTNATAVTAGTEHTCAVKGDGTVWCWGEGSGGHLGDNLRIDSVFPVQVTGTGGTGSFTNAIAVAAGGAHSCALKDDGTVWCWGKNDKGQLGDNTGVNSDYPVQVTGTGATGTLTNAVAIAAGLSHSCAVRNDGTLLCWGKGSDGQLGDNTRADYDYPVQVTGAGGTGTLTNATAVAAGDAHTCSLKNDGTVWCWGKNDKGQLGDNTGANSDYPVQVTGTGGTGTLTNAVAMDAGLFHACAVRNDGTLLCWGKGSDGQLGDNTGSDYDYPVQVTGAGGTGSFTGATLPAGGNAHSCAAKSDQTVWCWGKNDKGQLGDNTGTNSDYPVQSQL